MSATEAAMVFPCRGETLVGVLHQAATDAPVGVVIVVGGPQYRVGSHRQFVGLARDLASAGVPVLRFDCRGMGDSGGAWPGFEHIGDDIRAAIDSLLGSGLGIERVVLWGLCDAASAILLYAHTDDRVASVVLLNPWVRTEASFARTQLRHYYLGRLADREFWKRLITGAVRPGPAIADALGALRRSLVRNDAGEKRQAGAVSSDPPLPDRMARGLSAYGGPALLILSGNDLTAREFEGTAGASSLWRALLAQPRIARCDLKDADHTFSRRAWKGLVAERTCKWVRDLGPADRPRAGHPPLNR